MAQATPGVLRVSAIPDEAPTELQRKFKPLGDYLAKATGLKVEFTPVTDYPASVEGLITNKLDMVWFGGFTFVQAHVRSGGKVIPLVQPVQDLPRPCGVLQRGLEVAGRHRPHQGTEDGRGALQ